MKQPSTPGEGCPYSCKETDEHTELCAAWPKQPRATLDAKAFWENEARRFDDHFPVIATLLRDRGHSAWLAAECDRLTAELKTARSERGEIGERESDTAKALANAIGESGEPVLSQEDVELIQKALRAYTPSAIVPKSATDPRDAERYRWLREHFTFGNDSMQEIWFDAHVSVEEQEPAELDAAIDKAMKVEGPL